MSGTKSSTFFWSDWDQDPALNQCSLAAQGLWMKLLCICAQSDPVGYVAINGRALDDGEIAKAARRSADEIAPLLAELEHWGVFSRDRRGCIYNRRMVRSSKAPDPTAAERQRRSRQRKRDSETVTETVTCHGCVTDDGGAQPFDPQREFLLPNGSPLEESFSISFSISEEKKSEAIASHKEKPPPRATRLPENWNPSFDAHDFGGGLGLAAADVDDRLQRFRDYWQAKPGKAGTSVDWDATLRNWLRKAADDIRNRSPPRNGHGPPANRNGSGMMGEIMRRLNDGDGCGEGENQGDRGDVHPRRISGPAVGGH